MIDRLSSGSYHYAAYKYQAADAYRVRDDYVSRQDTGLVDGGGRAKYMLSYPKRAADVQMVKALEAVDRIEFSYTPLAKGNTNLQVDSTGFPYRGRLIDIMA